MGIDELMNTINALAADGYERGFVSFRSEKGIVVSPDKEFYKISQSDIEIVGRERNVNKEKAAHLTAYERNQAINVIIHVYPEYCGRLAARDRAIYPYSAAEATATGARLGRVIDNVYQISDGIGARRAALTDDGLYAAGATVEEAIYRVETIERAAKIEYYMGLKGETLRDDNGGGADRQTDSGGESAKSAVRAHKAIRIKRLAAQAIYNNYLRGEYDGALYADRFYGGFGYYSWLDNGVLCAADASRGEEIILNKKTAKGRALKLLYALYEGDYEGAAVIYNGAESVIAAGRGDTGLPIASSLRDAAKIAADAQEHGAILLSGYGALALGASVDEAFAAAYEFNSECAERLERMTSACGEAADD